MMAVGGKDGFAARFEAALEKSNLTEGWPVIKPYMAQLISIVSPRAANLTFQILELVAKRNQNDIRWQTGLTSHRITAMAKVLYERGFTHEEIEKKIEGILRLEEGRGQDSEGKYSRSK
jgi:hypothetical protein